MLQPHRHSLAGPGPDCALAVSAAVAILATAADLAYSDSLIAPELALAAVSELQQAAGAQADLSWVASG